MAWAARSAVQSGRKIEFTMGRDYYVREDVLCMDSLDDHRGIMVVASKSPGVPGTIQYRPGSAVAAGSVLKIVVRATERHPSALIVKSRGTLLTEAKIGESWETLLVPLTENPAPDTVVDIEIPSGPAGFERCFIDEVAVIPAPPVPTAP